MPGADQPTEVGNLAAALNDMLDRLQLSSEEREQTLPELRATESRMRRFVADAGHVGVVIRHDVERAVGPAICAWLQEDLAPAA